MIVVITPPAALLTPDDVRAQLGLDASVPDARLVALVAAATGVLDGPDGWLGRALGQQTLELRCDTFPCADFPLALACPPIASIVSVTYPDPSSGTDVVLDASLWAFYDGDTSLYPAYGHVWPEALPRPDALRVRYTAGYESVPQPILQAILLQVAALFAMLRADLALSAQTVPGVLSQSWSAADFSAIYDKAAARLLAPYRVFS